MTSKPAIMRATSVTDLRPPAGTEAVIFDWDGTLADSTGANYGALRAALGEHSDLLERSWFDRRTGLSTEEMVRALATEHGIDLDAPHLARLRNDAFLSTYVHELKPVLPVVDAARDAKAQGLLMAIATGGSKVTFEEGLRRLELEQLIDVRLTRDDVENGKPAPDLFLSALETLGVTPDRALVYEDSDEGLQAAHAARISAVDVRPLVAPERLQPPTRHATQVSAHHRPEETTA